MPERPGRGSPRLAPAGARPPILPDAPWFELPTDWNEQHPTLSPNARLDVHAGALAERQLVDTPPDLAGRFWLEAVEAVGADRVTDPEAAARPALRASSRQRFRLVFEVGGPGIADGGSLFLLADPFWFWSEVQTYYPAAPGFRTGTHPSGSDTSVYGRSMPPKNATEHTEVARSGISLPPDVGNRHV